MDFTRDNESPVFKVGCVEFDEPSEARVTAVPNDGPLDGTNDDDGNYFDGQCFDTGDNFPAMSIAQLSGPV